MENRSVLSSGRAQSGNTANRAAGAERRRRRSGLNTNILKAVLALLAVLLVAVGILAITVRPGEEEISAVIDSGTFFEGISVNGVDISGMTFDQAYEALLPGVNDEIASVNLSIVYGSTRWTLTSADLDMSSTLNEVLNEALMLGRSGTLIENSNVKAQLKEQGKSFETKLVPDDAKIQGLLAGISSSVNQEPIEPYAVPDTSGNEPAFRFIEGTDGHILDIEVVKTQIIQSLEIKEYDCTIQPELKLVAPTRTMDEVKNNTKLIAEPFVTSYEGRTLGDSKRVRNIEKASDILNGLKLEPGEQVSFNEYVGPRTEKGGWALAPGIVNGNTYEMQAGGGICQVSTTLYNALLRCGPDIEIVDRKKHSWPSSYVPEGLDATVSTGGPDLVFKNNTQAPIFIFTYAADYKMTVYVYGAPLPEGVTYVARSEIKERPEPPEPEIIEEPLWPSGFSEKIVNERKGCIATAYRDKLVNGEVVETVELYTDTYRAIRGVTKIGTGPETLPPPVKKG